MASAHDEGQRYSRDEDHKPTGTPGKPPRPATEPDHAEGSSRNSKTATDPSTGETNPDSEKKS